MFIYNIYYIFIYCKYFTVYNSKLHQPTYTTSPDENTGPEALLFLYIYYKYVCNLT